jgi:pyridoxamine 5'-phosphate oxidase
MMTNIADIRKDYKQQILLEADILPNAIDQFEKWWQQAINSNIDEVNAMTLVTANLQAKPTARIVLLKGFDKNGFTFFSNYESNKALAIEQNPQVCLVFFWKELERQIRIEGMASKLSNDANDTYFSSRPIGSKIGAWSSPQSKVIDGRNILENNVAKFTQQFDGANIPRPTNWGGYCVAPTLIEFWQGRPSRLHDRLQYTLVNNTEWQINRLAP